MSKVNLAQACIDRTGLQTGQDDAIFTTHWQSGQSADFSHADRVAATTKLATFWTEIASTLIHGTATFREVKWYEVPDAAPHKPVFVEALLPAAPPGISGSLGGAALEPQSALTVTWKTDSRKHWGRFYLPGLGVSVLNTTGQLGAAKASVCDVLATAAVKLCRVAGTEPVVVVWSKATGTTRSVLTVQVDDIVDIQRSRRQKKATYKKQLTP